MFDKIIDYSVRNKFIVGLMVVALIVWGSYSLRQIPIDAVPDITNNQVQIITISPTLATQEIEQFITTPIELSLQNLQRVEEIRSISRFGLSVITVVFEESHDIYLARQLVNERLAEAQNNIPEGLGTPEMAPISTGLGEIYQYVVRPEEGYEDKFSASELRSIQDWIVKRQLAGIEGVAEINSMGGFLKQYEIAVKPDVLKSMNLSINDVFDALEKSNENTGGAYIEKNPNIYYIRTEGLAKNLDDLGNIVVKVVGGTPVLIKDVAHVQLGEAPRYGALVKNGEEVVGGKVMMFKGANSAKTTALIKEKVVQIQKSLPEGVVIEPYLVRDKLVTTAIGTVKKNLIEGGLIIVFILVIMLGNWRAGLIVASVIPLAMLFAISTLNLFGISANLMSLGAIDFGLIVDGAVIIVESIVHRLTVRHAGKQLTAAQMDDEVIGSSQKIRSSAAFGEIIILMVYIPILALVGIEGKMFRPMAQTVMLAIAGALILSLTYVPMMTALFLNKNVSNKKTIADRVIGACQRVYDPFLDLALKFKTSFVVSAVVLLAISIFVFSRMGGEFIPTLEEGDLAMHQILVPGSSLTQSVETAKLIQNTLLENIPDIIDDVVIIGSSEIPTDPMPTEIGDHILVMKPKSEWTTATTRQEMYDNIQAQLVNIPGVSYEYSQPIQMRFNELMTGTRSDIAIKLYGDDLNKIYETAKEAEKVINEIDGVGTVNVEQTIGMPQIIVSYNYAKMAQYGMHIKELNQVISSSFAGEKAGVLFEGEKRFDIVIRLDKENRTDISDVQNLFITLDNGTQVPLSAVADVTLQDAPMQISRENTNRRIVIGVNVGNTDVESLVEQIQIELDSKITLPTGYYFTYGGQFENLKAANARLAIAVPLALALIFLLLFFTFKSLSQAALIFTAIPLSAIGGIWALQLRGMPFSISAGIGFIALFGVAVLNGIVLIGYFNQLKKEGMTDLRQRILEGTKVRLRPVLMTAAVASLGFLPMALSNTGGAEVQRPLATVVIGGLISATILTLLILPILYSWLEQWKLKKQGNGTSNKAVFTLLILLFFGGTIAQAQQTISLDSAIIVAIENHPSIKAGELGVQKNERLSTMKYNLGTTDFSYQGDGLVDDQFGQQVHQVGLVQNIPNPSAIKSMNRLNKQVYLQSIVDNKLLVAQLSLQVKEQYFSIQYKKQMADLYNKLVQLYTEYYRKAEVRYSAGAVNGLEKLNIQSKLQEYEMLKSQTDLLVQNLEQQFQLLINSANPVTANDTLRKFDFVASDNGNSLWEQDALLQTQIEKAEIGVLKSEKKPDFNVGYAAQNFSEGGWLNAVQAGVSIPFFNGNTRKKIQAQQFQLQSSEWQVQAVQLNIDRQLLEGRNAIDIFEKGVDFYDNQLAILNPEIERITQLNYQAGALTYLELLNVLNLLAQNESGYLTQLYEYNKAVAQYQFLTNN